MKAYKLLYAVGMIDGAFVEKADAEWQRKLHRKPKIILMSAACIALSMAMLLAAFSFINEPTADPTGTTPPGNILPEGTPSGNDGTTPTPPDQDTPNEPLSEVLEVGYSSSSGGGSGDVDNPIKIAAKMPRTAKLSDGKILVTVSYGLPKDRINDNNYLEMYSMLNSTVKINFLTTKGELCVKEMSFDEFADGNYIYSYAQDRKNIEFISEETFEIDLGMIPLEEKNSLYEYQIGFEIQFDNDTLSEGQLYPAGAYCTIYYKIEGDIITFYTWAEYIVNVIQVARANGEPIEKDPNKGITVEIKIEDN